MCIRKCACAVVLLLIVPALLLGQRTSASLSGTITDPSGAVIAGAQITAVATATGATTKAETDTAGFYILPNLTPGTYRLTVECTGFQVYIQEGIVLQVDQTATMNASLKLGSQTQKVTVEGRAGLVDVRSPTVTTSITTEMAEELPLNGRNVLQLMSVAPDVSRARGGPFGQTATRPESVGTFVSASGGLGNSSGFYLDGGINEDPYTQVANIFPNPDAIQEFSFQTNNYSAKFGGRGGGIVNAVTRSGTNQFHGSVFEFLRNNALNARNFFAPTDDGLKRNQYGFTFGGPIKHDKTFFFGSWQATKLRSRPSQNVARTFTAAQLNGDFSDDPNQLVDPDTGMPFPGNQVPTSMFDSVALNLVPLVPVGSPGTGLTYFTSTNKTNDNQWVTRVDHTFNDKVRLYGRYLYDRLDQPGTKGDSILAASPDIYWKSQNATVSANWIVTPSLSASFSGTFNRATIIYTGPDWPNWTELGAQVPHLVTGGSKKSLGFGIGGYFGVFWDGLYRVVRNQSDFTTNWTWIKGSHTVEFGGELIKSQNYLDQDFFSDGYYSWSGQRSGNNMLDFLLGRPSYFGQIYPIYESLRRPTPAAYVTDTWKATRRLTLTLGVRWNAWLPWHDIVAGQTTLYSPEALASGTHSTRYPNLPAGLLVDGDPGVPEGAVKSFHAIFDPRIGFAFDPFGDGKTSIRGGYGLYHDEPGGLVNNRQVVSPPWTQRVDFNFPDSTVDPYSGHVNPFIGLTRPFPSDLTFPTPFLEVAYDSTFTYPTTQQWNFTVERQLAKTLALQVAYEGSESYHLFGGVEGNAAVYIPGQSTFENTDQRRPNPNFTSLTLNKTVGTSSFNALTVSLEKRMSRRLSFIGGFRWAKWLDEVNDGGSQFEGTSYISPDVSLDRGLADADIAKQFTLSYVWQLPTPQSMGFFGRHVIGGWSTSGILTLRDGFPFSVYSGIPYSYSGIGADRADFVPGQSPNLSNSRSTGEMLNEYFNIDAFTYNAPGTFGNAGRNILRGPGFANFDFSLIKSFPIHKGPLGESKSVDFRAEAFNLFNHPNFGNPYAAVVYGPGVNGTIHSAGNPRIIQFGLKFVF